MKKYFLYKNLTRLTRAPKTLLSAILKKDLVTDLPYLGKLHLQIVMKINRILKNELPYCNFRLVFQTKCKISNFLYIRRHHHDCLVLNLINIMLLTAFLQSCLLVHILSSVLMSSRWLFLIWKFEKISISFMIMSSHVVLIRSTGLSVIFTSACNANRANVCGGRRIRCPSQDNLRLILIVLHGIVLVWSYRSSLDTWQVDICDSF